MASITNTERLLRTGRQPGAGQAGSTAAHTATAGTGTPERRTQANLLCGFMGRNRHFKAVGVIYRTSIEKSLYEPFSDEWCYCVNELQKTEYQLDILCAADCKAYPRMKAYHEYLPSDRYQWLLDCLAVLAECGAFQAAEEELREIKTQAVFEVQRKPGQQLGGAALTGNNNSIQQTENARGTPDLARFHHYKLVNGKEVPTSVFDYEVFCYIKENYPIFICGFPICIILT